MFTHAITRQPGPDFVQGITTSTLGAPEYKKLLQQHAGYIETLRALGLEVTVLEPLPGFPDAYFVEDDAVVTPEVAVITRPGALARRGEVDFMEPVLAAFRPTLRIEAPGTLDGGDVMMAERHFMIGLSDRTNQSGAEQLGHILAGYGYTWNMVPVAEGLHFKSSVNYVGAGTLLVTPAFADRSELRAYRRILVDEAEAYASNTLLINGSLITPSGFPCLRRRLQELGLPVIELDVSEPRKMDGGLSCMSLRF